MLAREHERNLEAFVVLGESGEVQVSWSSRSGSKGRGHLAAAIGAVIEKDASIVLTDQTDRLVARIHYSDRLDELVSDAMFIGAFHGGNRIVRLVAVAKHHD